MKNNNCVWCAFIRRCIKSFWDQMQLFIWFLVLMIGISVPICLIGKFMEWLIVVAPTVFTAILLTLVLLVAISGFVKLKEWLFNNWREAKKDCENQ